MPRVLSNAETSIAGAGARYRAALMRFFRKRLHNHADAEDLTQEVLMRLHRRAGGTELQNIEAYLFQAASNLLHDRLRRQATHHASEHVSFEESAFEGEVPSEERVLEGREALTVFLTALEEMPPKRKLVFTMHRFMGMSYGAIALRLGISVGVVEKHMIKALLDLHARMGEP